MKIRCTEYNSPCGKLMLGSVDGRLCVCDWAIPGRMELTHGRLEAHGFSTVAGDDEILKDAICQLDEYFASRRKRFDLPLRFIGTDFQIKVWNELLKIGYGQTITYGRLASNLGMDGSARATGSAVGANIISVIVPCHRVVPATGGTGNYAGGKEAKRILLATEIGGNLTPELSVPF